MYAPGYVHYQGRESSRVPHREAGGGEGAPVVSNNNLRMKHKMPAFGIKYHSLLAQLSSGLARLPNRRTAASWNIPLRRRVCPCHRIPACLEPRRGIPFVPMGQFGSAIHTINQEIHEYKESLVTGPRRTLWEVDLHSGRNVLCSNVQCNAGNYPDFGDPCGRTEKRMGAKAGKQVK